MSEGGRHTYSYESGFSHAELLKCLPSAVAPYVLSELAKSSYARSFALSFENRIARLHLEPEKIRQIASIKLPITTITIEFENFSESQYRKFIERFKKYLHRGGG